MQKKTTLLQCPSVYCDDRVDPTSTLHALFKRREQLIAKDGSKVKGLSFLELEICEMIKTTKRQQDIIFYGRRQGWPTEIKWQDIVPRILAMQSDLTSMIANDDLMTKSLVWKTLNSNLTQAGSSIKAFSKSRIGQLQTPQRPG